MEERTKGMFSQIPCVTALNESSCGPDSPPAFLRRARVRAAEEVISPLLFPVADIYSIRAAWIRGCWIIARVRCAR